MEHGCARFIETAAAERVAGHKILVRQDGLGFDWTLNCFIVGNYVCHFILQGVDWSVSNTYRTDR